MTESATEAAIRQFLQTEVFYDRDLKDLRPDDSLLERGLLDSLAILKTVTFCEEQFGITIPDPEVLPDNLESVRAIARLVERCRGRAK
jgi:acyl carrier protein